ncbi:MAG TPA: flagellar assembly protein FliW [Pyrinomonadaceae bacterium]|nr:flagellar assembly protein FliW [Pyrinomonadaceae bacterium]
MSKVSILGKDYFYNESEVISFSEGLIGLPEMRRAALIPMTDYQPFYWLASLDDEKTRFIVVNPQRIFSEYQPDVPKELREISNSSISSQTILTIVKISSEWEKTTVNLRAPIFINEETKHGAQFVLNDSNYQLAETIP